MDKQLELKICSLYKEGITCKNICTICHCSTNTISKIIDKYNIPRRQKRHNVNKDISKFLDLDNPETQYWLGYICADGNINYNKKSKIYKVSLFSKDSEVIDKFIKYFGEDVVCKHIRKQNGVIEGYINSKLLCEFFINELNITPNKSLTLDPHIEYTPNFILGYFDGDGCIRNSTDKITRYECNITSGSINFLHHIGDVLTKNGIFFVYYKHTDCNAYKIRIDRKEDSKKFYKFLYKDAVVCLSRKLKNFAALYGDIKNKKLGELQEVLRELAAEQIPQKESESSTTNT